jgi:hypothetical protein
MQHDVSDMGDIAAICQAIAAAHADAQPEPRNLRWPRPVNYLPLMQFQCGIGNS